MASMLRAFRQFRHGKESSSTKPIWLETRTSRWFIIFVVSFAVATDIFMYGVIVPVTPTALEKRVGLSPDSVQSWTSILVALYSAALLTCSPIVGYLADRFESRRWPLLLGLIALGAATALLCVGTHLALWIVGRLAQGAAAAVVWTVGLALMVDTIGKEGLGQGIGYVSLSMSIGMLAGPLLGGVLYQHGGYYAVFGLAFGLVAFDVFFRVVLIERKHAQKWLAPETAPTPDNQLEGDTPPESKEAGFHIPSYAQEHDSQVQDGNEHGITIQTKHFHDRVLILLDSPRLFTALWAYFVLSLCLGSFDSVLPLFVRDTFGWQQTGQGLIFLPLMIPHIVDPITGAIIDRFPRSPRYIASGAFLCAVPVMVLMRLVTENTMQHKIILCALLALVGLCVAVAMPPLVAEVFYIVKEKEEKDPNVFGRGGAMALAFGLINVGFAAGSLVGPFFAGFIRDKAGWGTMTWAMALITGVSALPLLLFLGGWVFRKPDRST